MRQDRTVHRALINEVYVLSGQIIQTVQIHRFLAHHDLLLAFFYFQYGLKHDAGAVLDELSHRMQIRGQVYRCREDTLVVFAF